jgi:hypothetical protein
MPAPPPLDVIATDTSHAAPAVVEAVPFDRVAVREPFEVMEHYDQGDEQTERRAFVEVVGKGLVGGGSRSRCKRATIECSSSASSQSLVTWSSRLLC